MSYRVGWGVTLAAAAAAASLIASCEEERDDLHPDVVADIARSEGDASGYDRTGTAFVTLVVDECSCSPDTDVLDFLSLCGLLDGGGGATLSFPLVQTDGALVVRFSDALSGSIDEDGAFDIGAVTNLRTVETEGYRVTRAQGDIRDQLGGGFSIDGRIRQRIDVDLKIPIEGLGSSVECYADMEISGQL